MKDRYLIAWFIFAALMLGGNMVLAAVATVPYIILYNAVVIAAFLFYNFFRWV